MALTIFIVSFLAMAIMVLIARHKVRSGKEVILFERRHRMETFLHKSISNTKVTLRKVNKESAGFLFHAVVDTIEGSFVRTRDVLHKRINQFLNKVRGQIRK